MTLLAAAARWRPLSRPVAHEAFTELVATAFLLIAVVGSGIMGERLCTGNVGLALLANAIATGGALVALILAFGPQSGAHMNPVVTLAGRNRGLTLARGAGLHRRPDYRRHSWCVAGAYYVRSADLAAVTACPHRASSVGRRGGRNVWPADGDLGMPCAHGTGDSVRRRGIHRRGVLVYRLDLICQSRGDDRTCADRYVRRDSSRRCAGFHRGAIDSSSPGAPAFARVRG